MLTLVLFDVDVCCCCRAAIGVPQLTTPPSKFDLLNARWCSPTLSIVDIRTTGGSYGKPAMTPAAAAAAAAAANLKMNSSSSNPSTPPLLSPRGVSEYAHSPAALAQGTSGNYSSCVAAALNLGLQPTVQQQKVAVVPRLPLGGCVHGHHSGENKARWPTITPAPPSLGVSHLGGAAGFASGADDKSCYRFGPTRFSVIPKVAVGKISLRFVPEQDHQTLIECLKQHVEKKFEQLWSANKVELQVGSRGAYVLSGRGGRMRCMRTSQVHGRQHTPQNT